ncbi:MAG TPA: aminotransferase class V-fold PLP-dependent enzyme, partial [Saprospiraceae bacterium]|nr:aminotransferase class V-fold PLP-dependent enzyme [Saprospiraceae bacterium]
MNSAEISIDRLRADTPGTNHVLHFNNAGCSLPTRQTLEAIRNYQEQEALHGGYEVMAAYADQFKQLHQELASLIRSNPEDVALTENASSSFNRVLYAFDWKPGDVILTSDIEYGNNYLNYLWLKTKWDIEIQVVAS